MPSAIVELAQAMADSLNAAEFSQEFTATRHYSPYIEPDQSNELRVMIVPRESETIISTRTSTEDSYVVDVGILKRAPEIEEVDALMALAQEITDHFRFRRLDEFPEAIWYGASSSPIFDSERLAESHQYISIVSVTYRLRRMA